MLVDKFPELLKEWDYEKNTIDPFTLKHCSRKRIWWICAKDRKHNWDTQLVCRTKLHAGCPFCSGLRTLPEESLGIFKPDLMSEWSERNIIDPFSVSIGSDRKVWWICQYGHEWITAIKHRAINKSNCPYCAGKKIGYGNSFGDNCLDLLLQWDYEKNTIDPFSIGPASHKKAWWVCENRHSWKSVIKDRSLGGCGCPHCSKRISKPANKWLDELEITEREYYININGRRFFVDGIDLKNNIIFEYLGNYWHGNPEIYNSNELHPCYKNKTYGNLYQETLDKINILKKAGYKVIYKWGP